MHQAIASALTSDSTLLQLLTGGIYHEAVEISRQATPYAFDGNRELLPCGLIKPGTVRDIPPFTHSHAQTVQIYLYQRAGYDVIEQAARHIYTLLHNQRLAPVNDTGAWLIKNVFTHTGLEDSALGCSLGLLRYEALISRQ